MRIPFPIWFLALSIALDRSEGSSPTPTPVTPTDSSKPEVQTSPISLDSSSTDSSGAPLGKEPESSGRGPKEAELTVAPPPGTHKPRPPTERTIPLDDGRPFYYDYASLRQWGLVVAAALFVTGIAVIACGKLRKFPRCRSRNRKNAYSVAQL